MLSYLVSDVVLGTNHVLDPASSGYTVIRAASKVLHPKFNLTLFESDLALLFLSTDAPLSCKDGTKFI